MYLCRVGNIEPCTVVNKINTMYFVVLLLWLYVVQVLFWALCRPFAITSVVFCNGHLNCLFFIRLSVRIPKSLIFLVSSPNSSTRLFSTPFLPLIEALNTVCVRRVYVFAWSQSRLSCATLCLFLRNRLCITRSRRNCRVLALLVRVEFVKNVLLAWSLALLSNIRGSDWTGWIVRDCCVFPLYLPL